MTDTRRDIDGASDGRRIGLLGATGVGVGAIVGGGILALAGVAYSVTGPGAIVAFGLNGVIALLTALSFAEMSTAFPQSGGTYTFAKKVLSVEAAFTVGWIVWFASIVAGVLYALGFASYAVIVVEHVWRAMFDSSPAWLVGRAMVVALSLLATAFYTSGLVRKAAGGSQWATVGKLLVFGVLIAGGLWALPDRPASEIRSSLRPFFPFGATGLFQAMGYTFIALQGFDLIAAVAGEVRDPARTIPRAMLYSLALALVVYLPLLFLIATVGMTPGQSIVEVSTKEPAVVMALGARNFLGEMGFWLVIVAAVLSMLSALQANLFAASRVALAMARDRTLPDWMAGLDARRATPVAAVAASAVTLAVILLLIPDLAAAGAASSLIFLISFALVHGMGILARRRSGTRRAPFRVPLFPLVPVVGGLACLALAVFQGIAVPSAGLITTVWLGLGGVMFILLLGRRARVVDAGAAGSDPHLVQLRGRSPLVLVPIANPKNATAMVAVANAISPPGVGRVLLLSVVAAPEEWRPDEPPLQLGYAQEVLGAALTASFAAGLSPEALTTIAQHPWEEIERVARIHRCESLLLGLSNLTEQVMATHIEKLMNTLDCDVVVLRAPPGWRIEEARRVLVPVGGRGTQDELRARLLGSLCRTGARDITWLSVVSSDAPVQADDAVRRLLQRIARDEVRVPSRVEVVRSPSAAAEISRRAAESDLVILGLQRLGRRRKAFGDVALRIARETTQPILMISRRG